MIDPSHYTNSERFTIRLDELELALKYPTEVSLNCLSGAEDLSSIIGKCIVANGCFDILHPGHLSLLAYLDTIGYRRGLRPIVALNSDKSVRAIKGLGRPIVPEESRSRLINSLKWPFTVVTFDEETPQRLMDLLQPKVVLKGSEYPTDSVVRWKDSEVLTVEMVPRWSTTGIMGDTR
jgi:rfaE bifunctional protein nucleotidyltransferase chain/domain